jgi:hydrogenase maturation protease
VVLGVGNVLLRDDGVGVHVVHELRRMAARGEAVLPPGTELIDGGTLGPGLLPYVAAARATVLVDAVEVGLAPGAVTIVDGQALAARAARGWPAGHGLDGLLAAARAVDPPLGPLALVGVQPAEIETGLSLSLAVAAALPEAVAATLGELARLDTSLLGDGSGSMEAARRAAEAAA